jgi:hypothetical protein
MPVHLGPDARIFRISGLLVKTKLKEIKIRKFKRNTVNISFKFSNFYFFEFCPMNTRPCVLTQPLIQSN